MPSAELPAGRIRYDDTGDDGPVLVLCHGVPMDGRVWRGVVPKLAGLRVITPVLPLGGHREPMRPDADLSQRGVARILADFLDALDLDDVTLVLNDWGGGQFLINEQRTERVGRLALVACEAFDNFPPPAARPLAIAAKVPVLFAGVLQLMRVKALRQAPFAYGGMALSGLDDDLLFGWFAASLAHPDVRRDFVKFAGGSPPKRVLLDWAEEWRTFTKPVLVVWADQDTMMPATHGPRLVEHYPNARLELVSDSSTLVPLDQPERLAGLLREFATSPR